MVLWEIEERAMNLSVVFVHTSLLTEAAYPGRSAARKGAGVFGKATPGEC